MAITPRVVRAWVLLLAATIALSLAYARDKKDEPYALIFGTVYDANNHAVQGIKVKIARLKDGKPGKTWDHISDRRGEFAQRVPAGAADYLIWADIKQDKKRPESTRPEVKVHIENDERRDISLHLIQ